MIITELLKEKGISRYSLSKTSGVPWATLSDICSGKTSLKRSNAETISKLAKTLDLSVEELLSLGNDNNTFTNGKPTDKNYLETNLSPHLKKALDEYIEGEKNDVSYLDCLWGELSGSINADLWSGVISEEQANYLRNKYL